MIAVNMLSAAKTIMTTINPIPQKVTICETGIVNGTAADSIYIQCPFLYFIFR